MTAALPLRASPARPSAPAAFHPGNGQGEQPGDVSDENPDSEHGQHPRRLHSFLHSPALSGALGGGTNGGRSAPTQTT